jgi:hypothetical protein
LSAEFVGEIAHDARQLLPGVADRLHARLLDAFLQLSSYIGQWLQRRLEFRILVAAHDFEQLIARQHQLGHHRHQVFERIDGDADRLPAAVAASSYLAVTSAGPSLAGLAAGGGRLNCGCAERPFEIVERILARPQRALEYLRSKGSDRILSGVGAVDDVTRSTMRRRSEIRSALTPSGSHCSRSSDSRICLIRSIVARMSVTASLVAGTPSRNLPIGVSTGCASASSRGS